MGIDNLANKVLASRPVMDGHPLPVGETNLFEPDSASFWGGEIRSALYLLPLLWVVLRIFMRISALSHEQQRMPLSFYTSRKRLQPQNPTFDTTTGTGVLITAAPVLCYAMVLWPLRFTLMLMGFFTLLLVLAVARGTSLSYTFRWLTSVPDALVTLALARKDVSAPPPKTPLPPLITTPIVAPVPPTASPPPLTAPPQPTHVSASPPPKLHAHADLAQTPQRMPLPSPPTHTPLRLGAHAPPAASPLRTLTPGDPLLALLAARTSRIRAQPHTLTPPQPTLLSFAVHASAAAAGGALPSATVLATVTCDALTPTPTTTTTPATTSPAAPACEPAAAQLAEASVARWWCCWRKATRRPTATPTPAAAKASNDTSTSTPTPSTRAVEWLLLTHAASDHAVRADSAGVILFGHAHALDDMWEAARAAAVAGALSGQNNSNAGGERAGSGGASTLTDATVSLFPGVVLRAGIAAQPFALPLAAHETGVLWLRTTTPTSDGAARSPVAAPLLLRAEAPLALARMRVAALQPLDPAAYARALWQLTDALPVTAHVDQELLRPLAALPALMTSLPHRFLALRALKRLLAASATAHATLLPAVAALEYVYMPRGHGPLAPLTAHGYGNASVGDDTPLSPCWTPDCPAADATYNTFAPAHQLQSATPALSPRAAAPSPFPAAAPLAQLQAEWLGCQLAAADVAALVASQLPAAAALASRSHAAALSPTDAERVVSAVARALAQSSQPPTTPHLRAALSLLCMGSVVSLADELARAISPHATSVAVPGVPSPASTCWQRLALALDEVLTEHGQAFPPELTIPWLAEAANAHATTVAVAAAVPPRALAKLARDACVGAGAQLLARQWQLCAAVSAPALMEKTVASIAPPSADMSANAAREVRGSASADSAPAARHAAPAPAPTPAPVPASPPSPTPAAADLLDFSAQLDLSLPAHAHTAAVPLSPVLPRTLAPARSAPFLGASPSATSYSAASAAVAISPTSPTPTPPTATSPTTSTAPSRSTGVTRLPPLPRPALPPMPLAPSISSPRLPVTSTSTSAAPAPASAPLPAQPQALPMPPLTRPPPPPAPVVPSVRGRSTATAPATALEAGEDANEPHLRRSSRRRRDGGTL